MTELRDARFHKALESAPDAQERPGPQIAESIRVAARNAVAQPTAVVPAKAHWWRQFWEGVGSPRSPWSAALATVVLGVLITTLWVHEPIPDARAPIASAPVLAPVPMSESTTASTPAPTQPSATEPSARLADAAPPVVPKAARTAPGSTDAAVQQASRAAEPAVAAAPTPAATSLAPPAPAAGAAPVAPPAPASAGSPAPAPVPAPAQSPVELARKEAAADSANRMAANESVQGAVAALPSAAAPAAPAAPPAALSLAPAAKLAAPSLAPAAKLAAPASGLGPWTAVDMLLDGRSATLDAQQAQALMRQVQNLEGQLPPETSAPPATPTSAPDLQLTLRVQDRVVATLTLRSNTIRWQREHRLTLSGTLEEAQVHQLLQQAREALAGVNNLKIKR